jgi:hypothetical protein
VSFGVVAVAGGACDGVGCLFNPAQPRIRTRGIRDRSILNIVVILYAERLLAELRVFFHPGTFVRNKLLISRHD